MNSKFKSNKFDVDDTDVPEFISTHFVPSETAIEIQVSPDVDVRLATWTANNGTIIPIVKGDTVKLCTDGIVNAANARLQHGAGGAGAVGGAGGKTLLEESERWIRSNGSVKVGSVAVTFGGNIEGASCVLNCGGIAIS